jgi:hypothetical protein
VSGTGGAVPQKNLSGKYGFDSLLPYDSHVTSRLNQTSSATSNTAHYKQMSIRSHYNPQSLSFLHLPPFSCNVEGQTKIKQTEVSLLVVRAEAQSKVFTYQV